MSDREPRDAEPGQPWQREEGADPAYALALAQEREHAITA
jgi:hypothetical protein